MSLTAAALLLCCGHTVDPENPAGESPPAQGPNILLYVVDTLRADALATYGNPVVKTPNLDALARSGAVYRHARSVSSWTRASVASMLTGLYPEAHGAETRSDALSSELVVLPELLSHHGYAVGAIVANPNIGSFYGFARGFDDFIELYERSTPGLVSPQEMLARADVVIEHSIQWIDAAREPFFLFVLSIDPHDPYDPPAIYDRYGAGLAASKRRPFRGPAVSDDDRARVRSLYWGEVAFTDAAFGRLLWHLEERGLDDRTVVIFTSDHGEEFWEHGQCGHGKALFEESLRVPLIVRLAGGRVLEPHVGASVEGVDLFPTILELAGIPVPAATQGISLFEPETQRDAGAYASLYLDGGSLRTLVRRPWKLVHDVSSGREWLYHLDRDPGETRNISADFPEVATRLRLEMDAIANRASDRRPDAPQRLDEDLPARERALLEELGYLEPGRPDQSGTAAASDGSM